MIKVILSLYSKNKDIKKSFAFAYAEKYLTQHLDDSTVKI
jgi:hypothetical protein